MEVSTVGTGHGKEVIDQPALLLNNMMERLNVQLWTRWLFVVHAKHIGLILISNIYQVGICSVLEHRWQLEALYSSSLHNVRTDG